MSLFNYFVIATLSFVTIISVVMAIQLRLQLKKMAAMMISMAIGMNVGLTAGLVLGSFYQGNLYYSTILSIFTGALAGIACGLAFGILPSIEGFMAGMMGGMMGAMLGEMVQVHQAEILINIFLTFSVCTLLLFPILHEPSVKESKRKNSFWIAKPIFTFLLLTGYLFLGNQLDKQIAQSKSNTIHDSNPNHIDQDDKGHSNHDHSNNQKEDNYQAFTINVHPSNLSYDPNKIILKKGKQVRLTLTNHDSIEHDLEIKHFPVTLKPEVQHTAHTSHKADFHLHANPNNKSEMIFTPLQSGIYEFYCTIPGHKNSGMTGTIIVK